MDDKATYSDASDVSAAGGTVHLEGPDAVDVTLTPGAAEETSERLEKQAIMARGQRRLGRFLAQPKDE